VDVIDKYCVFYYPILSWNRKLDMKAVILYLKYFRINRNYEI